MAVCYKHFNSLVAYLPLHCHATAKLSPPPFSCFTFLKLKLSLFSTSIAALGNGTPNNSNPHADKTHTQQQNVVLQFLLTECGLSQAQISVITRRRAYLLNTRSAEPAQRVVQLFRDSGFIEDQVRKIIVRNPYVICLKSDWQLKSNIELLKETFSLTGKDLGNLLCGASMLLTGNLEKIMIPKIQYLQSLLESKYDLTMPLKKAAWIWNCNLERVIKPNVDFLQCSGVQGKLLSLLILKDLSILGRNIESLKLRVEYVRNMGISQASKAFVYVLAAVNHNKPECLQTKLKHLASFGLLEDEIKEHIRKQPSVLNCSIDKMQKSMDFFIHTAGLPPNIIVTYPALLTYSLETRIKPRYAVFKYISEMQLYKPIPSLAAIIQLGEQRFLDKYMKESPYAKRLLDIYSGKSVDL